MRSDDLEAVLDMKAHHVAEIRWGDEGFDLILERFFHESYNT